MLQKDALFYVGSKKLHRRFDLACHSRLQVCMGKQDSRDTSGIEHSTTVIFANVDMDIWPQLHAGISCAATCHCAFAVFNKPATVVTTPIATAPASNAFSETCIDRSTFLSSSFDLCSALSAWQTFRSALVAICSFSTAGVNLRKCQQASRPMGPHNLRD